MAGYFGDDSMLRRVNRERAVAFSGGRALLMQAAHPLAVKGLLAHSTELDDPYVRLERTAQVMDTIAFGDREDADRLCERIRAMHARVRGRLTEAVGPHAAGTPYRADDPELLMWVLFTLVDSGLVFHRACVGPLSRDEEAAYWSDYRVVGELFGLKPAEMPAGLDELDAYREHMLGGDILHVTSWSRRRARQIVLEPPAPLYAKPLVDAINFMTIALLPEPIRRQYDFKRVPPAPIHRAFAGMAGGYVRRGVLPYLPSRLRLVPAARAGAV